MILEYWMKELSATSLILERSKSSIDLLKGMIGNLIKVCQTFSSCNLFHPSPSMARDTL